MTVGAINKSHYLNLTLCDNHIQTSNCPSYTIYICYREPAATQNSQEWSYCKSSVGWNKYYCCI